jgi:Protein kinase domain
MSGMLPLRETDPREVGDYRLLGRLGEGGQGVVFLAASPSDSMAAVKLLPPTTDPQVRNRFLKEVAAAQRVGRFGTAQVLDAGIFERRPFIVSEYISGPSLVEVVHEHGPRGGAVLERIAIATLTALGAVHAAGMVHRDVKPGNVLLGRDGPVVIDFGLAAVPGMTTTGQSGQVALGTPAFMAPEALAATRVTAAADMWSWAVTIAFTGTGELPFKGESLTATAYAILHSEPEVGSLPEPLGSIVYRCLNKDPAARPTARDALRELQAAGAQLLGPLPSAATDLHADDETSGPQREPGARSEPRHSARTDPADARQATQPRSARRSARSRRRWRATAAATAVVLVAGAAVAAFELGGQANGPSAKAGGNGSTSQRLAAEAKARSEAVAWIVQQVSRAATVSCDAQVCADLASKRFLNLLTLGPTSNDPLGSSLVVATSAVRAQYGRRLATVYAPAVIASFGSGAARIDIRLVFPGGTTRFRAVAGPALQARKTADAELLTNTHIVVSPTARAQLLTGGVDPRLPLLLAAMAHGHRVRVVGFVDQSPGGGPASLLRSVDLAVAGKPSPSRRAAFERWVRSWLRVQRAQFRLAWSQPVTQRPGQIVMMIGYKAPSPLR